jgi:hypothetical protein
MAPQITAGAVEVSGGFGGEIMGDITANPHQAGGGGGGSYGDGGDGGDGVLVVPSRPGTALLGGNGILLQTIGDPATQF